MHRYVIADVFTDVPLEGNQLAVFLDAGALDGGLMQRVAREINFSETAFVIAQGDATADIRIFTPTVEMPFAGHPVLGTAFVLAEESGAELIRLTTPAGVVPVALTREGGGERIVFGEMEQPLPEVEPFDAVDELLQVLGVDETILPVEMYRNGPQFVNVTLEDEHDVASLTPDMVRLQGMGQFGVSCFARTATGVRTRMFGPALGVAEDPATGSAAGPLAVHLLRHGLLEPGVQLEIRQGEEVARPSRLYAQVEGTPERIDRVLVGGSAVIVGHGELRIGP